METEVISEKYCNIQSVSQIICPPSLMWSQWVLVGPSSQGVDDDDGLVWMLAGRKLWAAPSDLAVCGVLVMSGIYYLSARTSPSIARNIEHPTHHIRYHHKQLWFLSFYSIVVWFDNVWSRLSAYLCSIEHRTRINHICHETLTHPESFTIKTNTEQHLLGMSRARARFCFDEMSECDEQG